jgi:formylglycine-generating enzyme required for sulfatase activity
MRKTAIFAAFLLAFVLLLFIAMPGAALAADKTHTNSIGMEFALIPAGSFIMGDEPGPDMEGFIIAEIHATKITERYKTTPLHNVTISRPFYLGKYQVTQTQWEAVMGNNPSKFKGRNNPVENVSWHDAQEFIKRLNVREGHTRYRLPTEAEWEYAARAGTSTTYSFGNDKKALSGYAWCDDSEVTPHPVGQKQPNAWGLYDVHGNVWEWVQDWHGENYYASSPATDPGGPSSGQYRMLRGGSWYDHPEFCRSGFRKYNSPDARYDFIGFRLALSPE